MNVPFQHREDLAVRTEVQSPKPCHDARVLTMGGVEASIILDGTVYSLRITRLGKLILTK